MMLTEQRRTGRDNDYSGDVPARTPKHDLNDAASWMYVAMQERIDEFVEAPLSDLLTVRNCIEYLQSQILILELIDNKLQEG